MTWYRNKNCLIDRPIVHTYPVVTLVCLAPVRGTGREKCNEIRLPAAGQFEFRAGWEKSQDF